MLPEPRQDRSALRWIRGELDQSLRRARTLLEDFAEHGGGDMNECAAVLHQVHGALEMVQVYGAAMLVDEMERLAEALAAGAVKRPEPAAEALMLGMVQLPAYLEKIVAGGADVPLILLPLMNDLRAARDAPLVSETSLFAPKLNTLIAAETVRPGSGNRDLPRLIHQHRSQYHRGLLNWIRNQNPKASLGMMRDVLDVLNSAAGTARLRRLLDAAEALTTALADDDGTPALAVKPLFGKLDMVFKRVIDEGEEAAMLDFPVDLLKNLLYYVARSSSRDPAVVSVQQSADLVNSFPEPSQGGAVSGSLGAPDRELFDAVGEALAQDLRTVKDQFDLYIRGDRNQLDRLVALAQPIQRIGDTLGMVGRGDLRTRLKRHSAELDAAREAAAPPDDDRLMALASELLYVESALSSLGSAEDTGSVDTASQMLSGGEIRQHQRAAVDEALVEMAHTKEDILAFLETPLDTTRLANVPGRLKMLSGVLSILGMPEAGQLLLDLQGYVSRLANGQEAVPDAQARDALADVITSAELYMQSAVEPGADRRQLLEFAARALGVLGLRAAAPGDGDAAGSEAGAESETPESPGSAPEPAFESAFEPLAETAEPPAEALAAPPESTVPEPAAGQQQGAPDVDSEILEVFAEEAREVLQEIGQQLPAWLADPANKEALQTTRRSFHTLKGSGRIVGASVLGEFAWAVENLLNRVIDGTVAASPDVMGLMQQVGEVLPRLVDESTRSGGQPEDVSALEARAFVLASGEVASSDAGAGEPDSEESLSAERGDESILTTADVQDSDFTEQDTTISTADSSLQAVFLSEVHGHLNVLGAFMSRCAEAPGDCVVDEGVVRAMHTLRGSARTAGVEPIAEIAAALERLTESRLQQVIDIDAPAFDLLTRSQDMLSQLAEWSEERGEAVDGWERLRDEILAEVDAATAQAPAVPVAAEPALQRGDAPPETGPGTWVDTQEAGLEIAFESLESLAGIETEFVESVADTETAGGVVTGEASQPGADVDTEARETSRLVDVEAESIELVAEDASALDIESSEVLPAIGVEAIDVLDAPLEFEALDPGADTGADRDTGLPGTLPGDESPNEGELPEALPEAETEIEIEAIEPPPEVEPEITVEIGEPGYPDQIEVRAHSAVASSHERVDAGPRPAEVAFDPELLEIYLDEAKELLEVLDTEMHAWEQGGSGDRPVAILQRNLHTMKGGARLAGIMTLGDLSHALESVFESVVEKRIDGTDRLKSLVRQATDLVAQDIDLLLGGDVPAAHTAVIDRLEAAARNQSWDDLTPDDTAFAAESSRLEADDVSPSGGASRVPPMVDEFEGIDSDSEMRADIESSFVVGSQLMTDSELLGESSLLMAPSSISIEQDTVDDFDTSTLVEVARDGVALEDAEGFVPRRPLPEAMPEPASSGERVRVSSESLDQMVNNAGEVSIYRARMEQQNSSIAFNLGELQQTTDRLRSQLRGLELETEAQILSRHQRDYEPREDFDPLELDRYSTIQQLSRALSETVEDLSNLGRALNDLSRDTDTLLLQQARVTTDLQDGLLRTRMVRFASRVPRLERVVRQTSHGLGKQAELHVVGGNEDMDRAILERMMGPLEHLLRNAVSHGIEEPAVREAAGKQPVGRITLQLAREGTDVVLTQSDDGAGLDRVRIREKAIERGLIEPDARIDDDDLFQLILQPGFSTAQELSQVSGRGVGMDVVLTEVKQLGGSLEIDSQAGHGTSFTIRLPFTLAISDALLVSVGDDYFAVPHSSMDGVARIPVEELRRIYAGEQDTYANGGREYSVRYLGSMLGTSTPVLSEAVKRLPLLLVRSGEHRVAIQVDGLLGNRQIVVKSIGAQLSGVRWFTGGTILADGQIALILDTNSLVRMDSAQHAVIDESRAEPSSRGVSVMVVDDSITVRKVTSRLLERHNMNVITAKDGVDAVTLLQEVHPDVMLLDIEMPRMDGFELARHMRASDELKHIPIIMITSRSGDKHRERAFELGVSRYLGKPYQESELLENIYTVLADAAL